jgi:hypothetical protein
MGLVLGLPAMTRFDRSATPLTACFDSKPDLRPFTHRPANIQLDLLNPPARVLNGKARELAIACDRLNWSDVDKATAAVVSQAVWHSARPEAPFPWYAYHPVEQVEDEDE